MSIRGLSEYGAEEALAATAVMPNGTDVWVGLLTTMPSDRAGSDLVEATGSSYARVAHQDWLNSTVGTNTIRSNDGVITFPTLTGNLSGVVGWAIWDDDGTPVGNLIAFGELVDADDVPVTRDFLTGDQPQFAAGELQVVIGAGG